MPNRIEPMALKALGTKGMFHHAQIGAIRIYIRNKSESDIIEEIRLISDPAVFNILLEVGLSQPLQSALSKRWMELK
ncbi:hypothetical protein ES707_20480 [subsurface metagenome]